MGIPVSPDVKSVCDEIIGLGPTADEWRVRPVRSFWRATCVCLVRPRRRAGVSFQFGVLGDGRMHDLPLDFPTVAAISAGRVATLPLGPDYRPPREPAIERVGIDPGALESAMTDAVNVFVREYLVARGLIPAEAVDDAMLAFKRQVVAHWARAWWAHWANPTAVGGPGLQSPPVAPHP